MLSTAIPIVIAAIVIVIISNGIDRYPIIPNIKEDAKIFGIYDPAENDFNLNMWSKTRAEHVRSSMKRINKIKLSNSSIHLFENTILSISHPPKGMDDEEFITLKIKFICFFYSNPFPQHFSQHF